MPRDASACASVPGSDAQETGAAEAVEGDAILALMLASATPRAGRLLAATLSPATRLGGEETPRQGTTRRRIRSVASGKAQQDEMSLCGWKKRSPEGDARPRKRILGAFRRHSGGSTPERIASEAPVCVAQAPLRGGQGYKPSTSLGPLVSLEDAQGEVEALRARICELEKQNHELKTRNRELQAYADEFEKHCGVLV